MHINSPEHDDCFAIRQAARHISQLYERYLLAVGLTSAQFSILTALGRSTSLTMIELAQVMVMDRTTLVRALQPLLRDGLVSDRLSAPGKRRLQIALTSAGRQKLDDAATHWEAAQEEFERSFGAQEAAHLRRELFRVTRDVSKI